MVDRDTQTKLLVPAAGERVSVAWGLSHVTGRVVDVYTDIRSRVVVELDGSDPGSESQSVTVPLSAITPVSDDTPWAHAAFFERAVAQALQRAASDLLSEIATNVEQPGAEADVLLTSAEGVRIVVEVKTSNKVDIDRAVRQSERVANAFKAHPMLVVPKHSASAASVARPRHVVVVTWDGKDDDIRLREGIVAVLDRG